MPLPEWKKKVPGQQSLAARLRASILNHDLVRVFGRPGADTSTHGLVAPNKPMGDAPRTDQWNANAMVEDKSNVSATRPKHDRQRGDIVR